MQKEQFRELLEFWIEDVSFVSVTDELYNQKPEEILQMYQMVQKMWFEHRDVFPNKGTYKMVRRLFIKKLAIYCDLRPDLWRSLSPELCKEILHKADQTWISFNNELHVNFRQYLLWRGSQAGYSKRRAKKLCFVDENLKVVSNRKQAAGLANLLPWPYNMVEILFFRPLQSDEATSRSKAKRIIEKWNESHYSKYLAGLPTYATCCLANEFLTDSHSNSSPIVHSCHVDSIITSYSGKRSPFMLDSEANVESAEIGAVAKKVYVSIFGSTEDFARHNL